MVTKQLSANCCIFIVSKWRLDGLFFQTNMVTKQLSANCCIFIVSKWRLDGLRFQTNMVTKQLSANCCIFIYIYVLYIHCFIVKTRWFIFRPRWWRNKIVSKLLCVNCCKVKTRWIYFQTNMVTKRLEANMTAPFTFDKVHSNTGLTPAFFVSMVMPDDHTQNSGLLSADCFYAGGFG